MKLWLIRHLPPAVLPGICYGKTDLPLQTALKDQWNSVENLKRELPEVPVFSSPLVRCAELARVLSDAPVMDDRLAELDFGAWEMQAWEDIGPAALDAWAQNVAGFRPPQGETGYELQNRALAWLQEVSQRWEAGIVVTHAGVMRALEAHHQRLPGNQWLSLRYDYGQLMCLDFSSEQIRQAPVQ